MGSLFGINGIRGAAITELTCELAMQAGKAAAFVLTKKLNRKPVIFIGKDTRLSSDVFEAALCAGICSVGADVVKLGVLPVSATAYLTMKNKADAGIMISASHKNAEFNGIRFFSGTGYGFSYDIEEEIRRLVFDNPEEITLSSGSSVGVISNYENSSEDYINHILECVKTRLEGLKIAVDCSNGSASVTAEKIFTSLGADVMLIANEPDGVNINKECGSTRIDGLMEFVIENNCDCGLAFDGDADRCLAVDEKGELVDGDKLIALCAKSYKEQDKLINNTVVVTVMTNLGFVHFAKENGIRVVTTSVGDRYILEKMLDVGYNVGGGQNGHIIFAEDMPLGDGQLTGARILEILVKSRKKMSELASVMNKFPQVMINVPINVKKREIWKNNPEITSLIEQHQEALGELGRITVRENAAEPIIRVMVEGKEFKNINSVAIEIADRIKKHTL